MNKIDVAGLKIDGLTKAELIDELKNRIASGRQTWATTVYSEFLYAALKDPKVMQMLNEADIAVPDGIGIFWAHKFLSLPLTAKSYYGKILQSFWQVKYSLFLTLINPNYCSVMIHRQSGTPISLSRTPIRDGHATQTADRIPGSELIWDLAKMASENNLSIYLLGGFNNTAELAAGQLKIKNSQLKIAGCSSKNPSDPSIYDDIKKASPDLLFVAYGPIKQEAWIQASLKNLPVKLAIGLGGTFDYIAGKRLNPPKFARQIGLEWCFRLITQPHRIKRIFNATFGLIIMLMRYKVFNSYPLRPNVAVVILNKENKVLACQRKQNIPKIDIINEVNRKKFLNYWQLPQGGIDKNENIVDAAKREAYEETGLKNLYFLNISKKTNTYLWNNALRKFFFNKRYAYKGQIQHVVYFKFSGNNQEIRYDATADKEFINSQWVWPENLDKIVHPERASLVKIVQTDLKEMAEKGII